MKAKDRQKVYCVATSPNGGLLPEWELKGEDQDDLIHAIGILIWERQAEPFDLDEAYLRGWWFAHKLLPTHRLVQEKAGSLLGLNDKEKIITSTEAYTKPQKRLCTDHISAVERIAPYA